MRCTVLLTSSVAWSSAMQVRQQKRIEFRVGISVGDIILDDDDIYGDGVNLFNFGEDLPSHRHGHRVWQIVQRTV